MNVNDTINRLKQQQAAKDVANTVVGLIKNGQYQAADKYVKDMNTAGVLNNNINQGRAGSSNGTAYSNQSTYNPSAVDTYQSVKEKWFKNNEDVLSQYAAPVQNTGWNGPTKMQLIGRDRTQSNIKNLQYQVDYLQNQLGQLQQRKSQLRTYGDIAEFNRKSGEQNLINRLGTAKTKLTNAVASAEANAEYNYYNRRSLEDLYNEKKILENFIKQDEEEFEKNGIFGKKSGKNSELNIVNRVIEQKEREEQYKKYAAMFQSADFDGSYDPSVSKNDVYYQAVNGRFGNNALGERIYYVENNFDEVSDAERQIYNYIYKTQGKAQAEEFFRFIQSDLNLRDRINKENEAMAFAKEHPAQASVVRTFFRLTSPLSAMHQIANAFSDIELVNNGETIWKHEGGIDQNATYNYSSYLPTAIQSQVAGDLTDKYGSQAADIYNVGMSVADNMAQMLTTFGTEPAILGIMGSSVFADRVVQGKDAGMSDAEIISDATVRAFIEIMTEKAGLDNVLSVVKGGGIGSLVKAVFSEGAEEGVSNLANLFYDSIDSVLKGEETDIRKEIDRYKRLGYSDSQAASTAIGNKMADFGMDVVMGALSGLTLSGMSYAGSYAGDITKSKAQEYIDTSLDQAIETGLSLDSDSRAYKSAEALKNAKGKIAQAIGKLQQINLNNRETTKEFADTVSEAREAFRNTSLEDFTQVFNERFDNAKSETEQIAVAVAAREVNQELAIEAIKKTNPTIASASANDLAQFLRLSNATIRTKNGEIVSLDNVWFDNEEQRTLIHNAVRGLTKTSDANDYVAGYNGYLPAQVYDTVWKTAHRMGQGGATLEQIKANKDVAAALEVYKGAISDEVLSVAMNDGFNSVTRVTEGEKSFINTMAEKLHVEVEFVDRLTDKDGNAIQGEFDRKTGKIRISTATTNPATLVFCHEFTHSLEGTSAWNEYKDTVINKLKEDEATYQFMLGEVKRVYGDTLTQSEIESELVSIASENFLVDEAFVNSLKDKPFYRRLRNVILNKYSQSGADSFRDVMQRATMKDQAFFEELGKKWIDMVSPEEKSEAAKEDMQESILPEKYSKAFASDLVIEGNKAVFSADRVDYLVADSGAGSRTDYARKWATSINPTDFINLTTKDWQDREKFDSMPGDYGETNQTYDYLEGLKGSRVAPFLEVDIDTGEVVGHEGRHRMRALEMNGITNAAITVEFYRDGYLLKEKNGYGNPLDTISSITISNQAGTGQTATIQNIIPINQSTKEEVLNTYGENASTSGDIVYSRSFDSAGRQLTEQQESYFADSKVRDEDGDLLRVYHGTVREFYEFDREYANPEGNMGAGYYFTSSEDDADWNYANEDGPDLTNKIESEADRLEYSDEYEGMSHDEIVEALRKKYISEPNRIDAYLNITNPVYVGSHQTYLLEDVYNLNEEDYESEDEYYEALDEAVAETIDNVIDSLPWGYEAWFPRISEVLFDAAANGGIVLESLKNELNEMYIEDDQGRFAGNEVARLIVEALGYDGIIDDTVSTKFRSMGLAPDTTHYIIFDSNQAKDITNEDPTDSPDRRYSRSFETSREAAPVFYSQLERVVELYKGDKIGASSLIPYLKGRGVKDEEIKWSGLATFLEGKKSVSKEEVVQFLKDNQLEIVGTTLFINGIDTNNESEYFKAKEDIIEDARIEADWRGIDYDDIYIDEDNSVWYAYPVTDKGGYREVDFETQLAELDTEGETQWKRFSTPGGENYREFIYRLPDSDYTNDAMEAHWEKADLLDGATGIVAHARVQDFGDTLFVEEIQSDWHNAGEKQGYARTDFSEDVLKQRDELDNAIIELNGPLMIARANLNDATQEAFEARRDWLDTNDENPEWKTLAERYAQATTKEHDARERYRLAMRKYQNAIDEFELFIKENGFAGVPDAPFKNGKYIEYVLKDLLREAAEDGKKYLAWTPGWMQEDRWSDDYAEGYRIEYDQDIPKFLRKYGKQWGANLTEVSLDGTGHHADEFFEYDYGETRMVPAIEITDAMRESVIYEGQPMFSRAFESAPEQDTELLNRVSDALSEIDVSNVKLTEEQINKIARRVKRGIGSEYSTESLAENLKRAFAYWTSNKNTDFNALTQIMSEIMMPVVDEIYDYSGDSRRRKLVRNKTFIISRETANQFGSINELNQSLLRYGVAFTTNKNHKPADRRIVVDGEVQYVPSTREVLSLTDNWVNRDFSGVADDLMLDASITDEAEMVRAMVDFLQTEKSNARRPGIPEEFRETFAYNLALKAYDEFIGESRVSLKDVNQRTDYLVGKESQRILNEVRAEYITQYLNLMAEGEELIRAEKDKVKERAQKAHYFDMLKKEMKRFERLATRPSKNRHFDFDYMKYIGAIGSLVDLTSNRRVSRTNNALMELAGEYQRLASMGMYQNGEYDPTIENMIYETAQLINGRKIRELRSFEIKKVYDAVHAFIHAATQLNNFIDLDEARDINEAGEHTVQNIRNAKGTGTSIFDAIGDWWITTSLNPLREIDRIIDYHDDDPTHLLLNKLIKGEINIQQYKMEMSQIFKDMDHRQQDTDAAKKRAREFRKRYDKMNDTYIEVTLGGETQTITEAQKLALIMHARNSDNLLHILYGGIRLQDNTLYKRGNLSDAYARGKTVIPTEMELAELAKDMDEFETWFFNRCIYYFEVYSKDLINKTSLKLEGFARAEVENYYPIRVYENAIGKVQYDIGTGAEDSGENIHSGMLMARTKSKLPIYLNSITQDLLRSQNFVSRYAGLAVPLRDFNRIYKLKLDNGTEGGLSVQEVVEGKWGKNATRYIDDVLKDLTNGRDVSSKAFDKAMDTLRSKSAQAVLTLNPSVSIKQSASYPTAIAELDYKSVARALVNPEGHSFILKRADQELIAKYTPLLWSRMAGMSTQEIAELSMARNKGIVDKGLGKLPFLTDWIRKVDVATVGRLWYATQYWVDDHYKNVEKGSDEYYRIVADKFEDVVTKTQPNYTVMTRPDVLRTKNSIVKAIMMFKTQPLQNFGILYDASARLSAKHRQYIEAKGTAGEVAALAEYRAAGAKFARSISSQLLQTAVFTGMTFLANALILHRWDKYKDDELNEITAASVMEQVMWDYMDSMFGNAVIVDWVENIGEYLVRKFALGEDPQLYGISVFGIDNLNELKDLVTKICDKAANGDTDGALKYLKTFAEDIAQIAGIPAENVEKLIRSVWEYTLDFAQDRKITDLSGTTAGNYWNRIKNAYENGMDYEELFDDMLDAMKREAVSRDSVRHFITDKDDTGIMEWVSDMYVNGTESQKKMVEDWLDQLYDSDTSIKGKKRDFYEFQEEETPAEYLTKTEKMERGIDVEAEEKQKDEETAKSQYQEYSVLTDKAFQSFLNGGPVYLPYKKGDKGCTEQMARLYQMIEDKDAVKRFAVSIGYSAEHIDWTANRYFTKDLSEFEN